MAFNKGEKLKVERTPAQIQEIRDRIKAIDDILRDIKAGMNDNGIPAIELKIGTFLFKLGELADIAIDWKGVYEKAEIKTKVNPIREKKRSEIEGNPRNR